MSDTIYAIPIFAALLLIEFFYGCFKKQNTYLDKKDTILSLSLGLGQLFVTILVSTTLLVLNNYIYKFRIFDFGKEWYNIVILFLFMDLSFYWWHRASHRIRFLWANHVNHHSSKEYNFSTALRQPIFSPMLRPFFYIYIPFIGFNPMLMYSVGLFSLIWAILYHTKHIKKLGPLELILVTPSHHRVHHGSNKDYIDKNYGSVLIIWDKIFGTFQSEVEPVKFGLTRNINTYNPVKTIFHEWQSWIKDLTNSKSIQDYFKYTFRPPKN